MKIALPALFAAAGVLWTSAIQAGDQEWRFSAQAYGFHYRIESLYLKIPSVSDDLATSPAVGFIEGLESVGAEGMASATHAAAPLAGVPQAAAPPRPAHPPPGSRDRMRSYTYNGSHLALDGERALSGGEGRKSYLAAGIKATDYRNRNDYDEQEIYAGLYYQRWTRGEGWRAGLGGSGVRQGGDPYYNTLDLSLYGYTSFSASSLSTLSLDLEYADFDTPVADPHGDLDGWDRELRLEHKIRLAEGLVIEQPVYLGLYALVGEADRGSGIYDSNRVGWGIVFEQSLGPRGKLALELEQEVTDYPRRDGRPLNDHLGEEDKCSIALRYVRSLGHDFGLYLSAEYADTKGNEERFDSRQTSVYLGVTRSL